MHGGTRALAWFVLPLLSACGGGGGTAPESLGAGLEASAAPARVAALLEVGRTAVQEPAPATQPEASGPAVTPSPTAESQAPGADGPGRMQRQEWPYLLGLRWLAAHQTPEGRFPAAGFAVACEGTADAAAWADGAGSPEHDVATTGLALLAFLEAGYTHRGAHEFATTVRRAARWLVGIQGGRGFLVAGGGPAWAFDHAVGTWALTTLFGMTLSSIYRAPVQRALTALAELREADGLWRYRLGRGASDESLSVWALIALASARALNVQARQRGNQIPLSVDEQALAAVGPWLDRTTDPATGLVAAGALGACGRPLPGATPEGLAAAIAWLRLLRCEDAGEGTPIDRASGALLAWAQARTRAGEPPDLLVCLFARPVLDHAPGARLAAWEEAILPALLDGQPRDGAACGLKGSFAPHGTWGSSGGRVAATALGAIVSLTPTLCRAYGRGVPGCP